jgi:hypothetical protein
MNDETDFSASLVELNEFIADTVKVIAASNRVLNAVLEVHGICTCESGERHCIECGSQFPCNTLKAIEKVAAL